jgi:hypothetical protein
MNRLSAKLLLVTGCVLLLVVLKAWGNPVLAQEISVLGVHILSPHDMKYAVKLLKEDVDTDRWHYLTIPLTLNDLDRLELWQEFFKECQKERFIPIIRLATRAEGDTWIRPNRKQIVQMFEFMNQLAWPTEERLIIVFNEVNHGKEWGGQIDPISYTQILEFTADWAHTETASYLVLPAAMDLAASDSSQTMEAFTYLSQMLAVNPWIFDHIDIWNSHSYPNPAFSSSPERTGQNSMRGFEFELNYLKRKTDKTFKVIITETGWIENRLTRPWLSKYYLYALQHIWSHPQVIGVTPFIVKGAPGPFAAFSFFDENSQPTAMYKALREGVKGVSLTE